MHLEDSSSINRNLDGTSGDVTESRWVRRWAGCTINLILALDETVCDSEDGVDNYGVDAFGHLVLYWGLVGDYVNRRKKELTSTFSPSLLSAP